MAFVPQHIYNNYPTQNGFNGLKDDYLENWDLKRLDKVLKPSCFYLQA